MSEIITTGFGFLHDGTNIYILSLNPYFLSYGMCSPKGHMKNFEGVGVRQKGLKSTVVNSV
jgi:hypothetical protein